MPVITAIYAGAAWTDGHCHWLRGRSPAGPPRRSHRRRRSPGAAARHATARQLCGVGAARTHSHRAARDGVPKTAIHALGGGLVVARACHALGLRADTMQGAGRFVGAAGTALIVAVSSVWLIYTFVNGRM